jgi:hypothetical protein
MVVTNIYGQYAKSFIFVVVDGLGPNDECIIFFLKFHAQYI